MTTVSDIGRCPELADEYFDGYWARQNGEDDWDNPHKRNTKQWRDWHAGWVDAEFDCR